MVKLWSTVTPWSVDTLWSPLVPLYCAPRSPANTTLHYTTHTLPVSQLAKLSVHARTQTLSLSQLHNWSSCELDIQPSAKHNTLSPLHNRSGRQQKTTHTLPAIQPVQLSAKPNTHSPRYTTGPAVSKNQHTLSPLYNRSNCQQNPTHTLPVIQPVRPSAKTNTLSPLYNRSNCQQNPTHTLPVIQPVQLSAKPNTHSPIIHTTDPAVNKMLSPLSAPAV